MKKIDELKEHKDKIILVGIAGLWLFFTYYLVIVPYKDMRYHNKIEKESAVKLKKIQREFENVEKVYKERATENKKAQKEYQQYEKFLLSRSFENIPLFEEFIQKKIEKNYLQIKNIGNIETTSTDRTAKGKIYISYEIEGSKKDIKKFIYDIENSEKLISIMDSSAILENKAEKMRAIFKISGYLLNIVSSKKDTYIIEEKIYIPFNELNILSFKVLNFNKRKYTVIRYKDGKRKIIYQGEKIEIGNNTYTTEIKDNGIYLKNGEKE